MNTEKPKYNRESNPVADMMNWNEVIKKEEKNSMIYDKFNVYPTSSKFYSHFQAVWATLQIFALSYDPKMLIPS